VCQANARPVSVAGEHDMNISSVTILIRDIAYVFTSLLNTTHQLTTCKQGLENISRLCQLPSKASQTSSTSRISNPNILLLSTLASSTIFVAVSPPATGTLCEHQHTPPTPSLLPPFIHPFPPLTCLLPPKLASKKKKGRVRT
jgi:hypothetical protein